MSETGYYAASKMEVPLDDSPGPIRNLHSELDKALDVLQREISCLQAKLQPVLKEDENVRAVPGIPREDMGTSPFARVLQESLRKVEVCAERVREMSNGSTV